MRAGGPGVGSMDSNYQVAGCNCCEQWWEHSVALQGTVGVAALKRKAQRRGRELASRLKPGTFIVVEDRGTRGGSNVPFLIGITLDAGDGSCIVERVAKNKRIEGTRFDAGDYATKVKWYELASLVSIAALIAVCRLERLAEDPEQRTFELSNDSSEKFVINSTELRFSDIEMDKYVVELTGPVVRRSARPLARAQSCTMNKNIKKKYVLPTEIEQHVLKHCHD